MKSFIKNLFLVFIFFSSFNFSEAKSVVWPYTCSGCSFGGARASNSGVANPTFYITFSSQIRNIDTGLLINDNDLVPVGTRIKYEYIPVINQNFSWVGTGFSADSPYGVFTKNGYQDFKNAFIKNGWMVDGVDYSGGYYDENRIVSLFNDIFPGVISSYRGGCDISINNLNYIGGEGLTQCLFSNSFGSGDLLLQPESTHYVFFVAKIPDIGVSQTGTAGLSCSNGGIDCLITSPGTILSNFNFYNSSITSVNFPLVDAYSEGLYERFVASVPTQTIPFSFTAVSSNNPPATPSLPCTTITGYVGSTYNFTATSTDPDGDTIRYGFDFGNDGSADFFVPSGGVYVPSGTPQIGSKSWGGLGTYTVKLIAQDSKGSYSAWSPACNITINPGPGLIFNASSPSVKKGDPLTLSWTPSNSDWCWATSSSPNNDGGWTTAATGNSKTFTFNSQPIDTSLLTPNAITKFSLRCGNSTIPAEVSVDLPIMVTCNSLFKYKPYPTNITCNASNCGGNIITTSHVCVDENSCKTAVANDCSLITKPSDITQPCPCPSSAGIDGYKEVRP